ncbi:MAG: hypothetical protein IT338_10765 [Thermomicrobiales bacterium]|nr:hypothetical protein [Thermomicrobiales bacterium]
MASPEALTAWEYLVIAESERERLGDLGRAGWELVAATGNGGDGRLYLKRPVIDFRQRVTLDQRAAFYRALGLEADAAETGSDA